MADFDLALKLRLDQGNAQAGLRQFAGQAKGSLRDVSKTAKSASNSLDGVFDSLGIRSSRQIKADIDRVRDSLRKLGKDGRVSGRELARGQKAGKEQIAALKAEMRGANGVIGSHRASIGSLIARVGALAGAYLSVQTAINQIGGIISTGAQFEKMGKQLEALTGSSENAEKAMTWIEDFVQNTPFQLDGVTKGFTRLKAFGMDPMDGTYQAIADQAAALGGSQQELEGIVLALGQAWSKQKLQGEEILQLIERGVPVWELLAESTGKTNAELQDMSSNGELGREAIRGLIAEMGRVNSGAAAAQMDTFNGQLSNLQDQWMQVQRTIAEAGFLDYLTDEIGDLNETLSEMAESGELAERAEAISDALIDAADATKDFVLVLYDLRQEIGYTVAALLALKAFSILRGAATSVAALAGSIGRLKGAPATLAATGKSAGRAAAAIRALSSIRMVALTGGIGAVALGAVALINHLNEVRRQQNEIMRAENERRQRLEGDTSINAIDRDTVVKNKQALDDLNAYERKIYADRLDRSEKYWAARLQQLGEADRVAGGEISAETRAAAEELRVRREALRDLEDYADDREEIEQGISDKVADIKADMRAEIQKQMAAELKAYEDANKRIEDLQKERVDLEKRHRSELEKFDETARDLSGGDSDGPEYLDIYTQVARGKRAAQSGDTESAVDYANRARELIEAADQAGSVSETWLGTLLNQARGVVEEAQRAEMDAQNAAEAEASAEVDRAASAVQKLKEDAEWLQQISIGFDGDAADASADQLRAQLQKRLEQNPLVIPVSLAEKETKYSKRADSLLEGTPGFATGGLIRGTGTGTSDSMLARLSNGEYVIKAAAVRRFGRGFFDQLNGLRMPKFASGGLVNNLSMPSLKMPAPSGGGDSGGDTVYLTLGGQQFGPVTADRDVTRQLKRAAAMYGGAR